MSAPVCQVPAAQPETQPDPRQFPGIPLAYDLASALAAINAMRRIIQMLLNQIAINNAAKKPKLGNFTEVSRKTKVERIYNPDDNTQYVDVEHVTSVTMGDKATGQTWTWNR